MRFDAVVQSINRFNELKIYTQISLQRQYEREGFLQHAIDSQQTAKLANAFITVLNNDTLDEDSHSWAQQQLERLRLLPSIGNSFPTEQARLTFVGHITLDASPLYLHNDLKSWEASRKFHTELDGFKHRLITSGLVSNQFFTMTELFLDDSTNNSIEAGATEIKIWSEVSEGRLIIHIQDNGPGIHAKVLEGLKTGQQNLIEEISRTQIKSYGGQAAFLTVIKEMAANNDWTYHIENLADGRGAHASLSAPSSLAAGLDTQRPTNPGGFSPASLLGRGFLASVINSPFVEELARAIAYVGGGWWGFGIFAVIFLGLHYWKYAEDFKSEYARKHQNRAPPPGLIPFKVLSIPLVVTVFSALIFFYLPFTFHDSEFVLTPLYANIVQHAVVNFLNRAFGNWLAQQRV